MIMKFGYATFLALTAGIVGIDAFAPSAKGLAVFSSLQSSAPDNDDFINAMKGSDNSESAEEENSQGSSRFKEMMEAAKAAKAASPGGRAIPNPFLNPPPSPKPTNIVPGGLDNLSVEEQAALLRQLLANQGGGGDGATPPAMKEKRTDKAGKPVGRNRDADSIANSADLYFAQLKRDSTVRTLAKLRGEDDVADAVMEDEGIRQLEDLLVENPYLVGKKDEENAFFDGINEEALKPFLGSQNEPEEDKTSAGVSYKEMMQQRRMKQASSAQPEPVVQQPEPVTPPPPAPEPVVAQTPPQPEPIVQQQQPEPVVSPPPVEPQPVVQAPVAQSPAAAAASPEDATRQKLRTFMGLMLKHRGGPGFGKGELKGPEIDRFENMLDEITTMLREEAMEAAPQNVPMMTTQPAAAAAAVPEPAPQAVVSPAPAVQSPPADLAQVESAVACIEGATTMYKNSPPSVRESILVALRAALVSAVDTCSNFAGIAEAADYSAGQPGTANIAQIDGVVACIDGAVTMYKNSPPNLKKDVVVALRAALVSAVSTCNAVIGDSAVPAAAVSQPAPVAEVAPAPTVATETVTPVVEEPKPVESVAAAPAAPAVEEMDVNSKALESIYNKVKAASGNGSLGLRSDLTSSEASELADNLVEMRRLLMEELDAGIPDPGEVIPEAPLPKKEISPPADAGSTVSNYQQMLAKAKAQKAAEQAR